MTSERPRTTEARRIGLTAEALFVEACTQHGWIVNKTPLESDFGIDFRIEPVSDHRVDGIEFYAQVKGTTADPKGLTPVVRVEQRTVEYWRAKLTPIAVVSVNVQSRSIHYGWFSGTVRSHEGNLEVRATHEFPLGLLDELTSYYEQVREAAVRSSVLDGWLLAASALTWQMAKRSAIEKYPERFPSLEERHEDSQFTRGAVLGQIGQLLMDRAVSDLRRPIIHSLPHAERVIACRGALLDLFESHTVTTPFKEISGLTVPYAATGMLHSSFRHDQEYATFLASELTRLLVELRKEMAEKPLEVLDPSGLIVPWHGQSDAGFEKLHHVIAPES